MTDAILGALGGLGLFLIGMSIMTQGLKDLAGDTLRGWLQRFTRSPLTGATVGACGTAILQSSSATSVMAVGFVGAGLLTFPQALGVIFGANIGTTATGWMIALLGFKLSLSSLVMPLIFAGAMLRLLGGRRIAAMGWAFAGFGLIFAGITTLQTAMEGAGEFITPHSFPSDSVGGRALLVGLGIVITLVTQSSSAGVATAITAVHVGTISFSQAAAMVIGMDVGTTFTAALATVGGNVGAKRTGVAHVVYNLMTGVGAFLLLPWFVIGWQRLSGNSVASDAELALVSFHTLFNGLGVLLVLPFTNHFAGLIQWIVPSRARVLTQRLEPSLLAQSSVAISAVEATLADLVGELFRALARSVKGACEHDETLASLDRLDEALLETRAYMSRIPSNGVSPEVEVAYSTSVHILDHLARLSRRMRMQDRLKNKSDSEMQGIVASLVTGIKNPVEGDTDSRAHLNSELASVWQDIEAKMEAYRRRVIRQAGLGATTTDEAISRLDDFRWLRRVAYHSWRIAWHLDPTPECSSEKTLNSAVAGDDADGVTQ